MATLTGGEVFQRITKRLTEMDDEFASEFGAIFEERVIQRTPVDTGRLRDGWGVFYTESEVTVENQVPYAKYVEQGGDFTDGAHMVAITLTEVPEIAKLAERNLKKI